jgi:hypothetical protein
MKRELLSLLILATPWKCLLLSVMPSTSEIVTDIDNQIYKQLQDRLNQDEVVTGQGSSGQGAGIR